MARDETQRSVRSDRPLSEGARPVQLRSSRRFFTAQGNDQAVRQARALTDAVGAGVGLYENILEERNVEGAASAAQESAKGGERDEAITNKGYMETWDRIEASNDLSEMRKELAELLVSEGWDDLPEDQVQGKIDDFYRGQLDGINPDSIYGKVMSEGIFKHNADLLDVHRVEQTSRDRQDKRIMLMNTAREQLETDGTLDVPQLMTDSGVLLPGKGGRMSFMQILSELAIEKGMPELWDLVPDEFENGEPTGMSDPNFLTDFVRPAKNAAQAARDKMDAKAEKDQREATQSERALAMHGLEQRANAGDTTVIDDVIAAGRDQPGLPRLLETEQAQVAILRRLDTALATAGVSQARTDLFRTGNAYGLSAPEYDAASMQYSQEEAVKVRAENPDWDQDRVEHEVLNRTIERAVVHDRLPKHITDFLTVSTASPERYAEAGNIKRLVDAYDDTLVQRSIDDRVSASLDVYEWAMTETGGDAERAIEAVNQYDKTLSKGNSKPIREISEVVVESLANDMPGWGDYDITERDLKRTDKLVEHYWNMGLPPEQITKLVTEASRARNVRVGGVMYPSDFGWQQGEPAADWFLAAGTGGDFWAQDAELYMEPHPRKRGVVVVRDRNAPLYGSGPEFNVADIEADYQDHLSNQMLQAAAGNENSLSEMTKEAERRAMHKMFPASAAHEYSTTEQKWASITDEQRADAIRAELTQSL